MLYRYKPDEGRNARQITFWLALALLGYGCWALRSGLDRFSALRGPAFTGMAEVPLMGGVLSASLLAAAGLFVVLAVVLVRVLAAPKTVDRLIEVESEMRKVTWPSFKEASNSSLIVIGTVLVLTAFLAASDLVLGFVFRLVLFRGLEPGA